MTNLSFSLLLSVFTLFSCINAISPRLWIKYDIGVAATTPRLVMYVQTFHVNGDSSTPLSLLPLLTESTGITHVIFAMTHLNSEPGDIHLNDNSYNDTIFDQAWSEAKQLQAAGIKVMATMGGAGDGSYTHLADNFDAYYNPLRDLIREYALDGFDLDIEQDIDIPTVLRLINALYTDFGPDFLITMAPVASDLAFPTENGYSGFPYASLDSQAVTADGTSLVSWYNAQFYSGFGSPASTATYDSIVSAGWDPARVVMGVIDARNDGGPFVPLTTVQATISSLKAKYPTFGGVDGWEYFDAGANDGYSEPWEWVKSIGSSLFGTTTSVTKRVEVKETEYPPSPFSDIAIARLTATGTSHYEAIKALNRTSGDELKARSMVNEILARHLTAK